MRGDLGGCAVRTGRGVGERETWKGKGEKCNRKGEREWRCSVFLIIVASLLSCCD